MKAMSIIKNALIVLLAGFVGYLMTDNSKAYRQADQFEKTSRESLVEIGKLQSELKQTQAKLEMTEKECKIKPKQ